jgi:hypothetical protein
MASAAPFDIPGCASVDAIQDKTPEAATQSRKLEVLVVSWPIKCGD